MLKVEYAGQLISNDVMQAIYEIAHAESPWPQPARRELTRRERIVLQIRTIPDRVVAALHDRLFQDRYCDHDDCY